MIYFDSDMSKSTNTVVKHQVSIIYISQFTFVLKIKTGKTIIKYFILLFYFFWGKN
jgi:D-Tyr-tRNAtyr deacylase